MGGEAQETLVTNDEVMAKPAPQSARRAIVGPALANFAVQYNFQVIAIALIIADRVTDQKSWVAIQNKSIIFIGCILGQFLMGYAGDLLGRGRALMFTLALAVLGALGSAVSWGGATQMYTTIIVFRLIIGFGLGGVYPLSATKAAEAGGADEGSAADRKAAALGRASWAFFWQGPGMCAPYLATIVLRAALRSDLQDGQWRLLLALGAAPALAAMGFLRGDGNEARAPAGTNGEIMKAAADPAFWRAFAGTGGGWLLYDVAFYGFNLMGPDIVDQVFASDDDDGESPLATSWQQCVAIAFNIPAMLLSVYLLSARIMGIKKLQILGFVTMAASYGLFLVLRALGAGPWLQYGAYCLLNFTLSFGPNVTTFVLPSATYPAAIRSTMNGLSSAAGKAGAVIGTEALPVLQDAFNLDVVLWFCLAVSLGGALVTAWAVEPDDDAEARPDVDAAGLLVEDQQAAVA
mmetsp:Transcript_20451/g.60960  ORF Transcript_20451/g.60960 Transcript_20451/m.60960 type:complete len:463 (+) Transcript_20451:217-1605(+)